MPIADYVLSLCDAIEANPNVSLGVAVRISTQNSEFNVEASKVIHGLVTFSPAAESVAVEFLNELEKVRGMVQFVQPVLAREFPTPSDQWGIQVLDSLCENSSRNQLAKQLENVTYLASEYLSHLLIATRNLGGKKTPQVSVNPSPNHHRTLAIRQLLIDARINRDQNALKELLYRRDGYICPLSGLNSNPDSEVAINSKTAYILPFSFHSQALTLETIERFTGYQINASDVSANINDPCNAFNVHSDAREFYDNLSWGIEAALQPNGTYKYIYRKIRSRYPPTIGLDDGDEIAFGGGEKGYLLALPNPAFCNLKLAIARVMHACGASEIFDQLYQDDEDEEAILTLPVYLGGPCVSDDVLLRRLDDKLYAA